MIVDIPDVDADMTRPGIPGAEPQPRPQAGASGPLEVGHGFGGRYHIIRLLGMGGMGAVYQAWDTELEVALALKVIRPDATEDPDLAAEIERRFKRELLLARQVTHPNVVRIHDLGEFEGIKYITMPYIQGTDLGDILTKQGTLAVPEALPIASQIAAGLLAAHDAGVIHRDLKPANIMIDANRHALIRGFRIARASASSEPAVAGVGLPRRGRTLGANDATRIGTVIGSIDYMAPEQARGEKVDHRADIYAFGLILYRMLVGRRLAAAPRTRSRICRRGCRRNRHGCARSIRRSPKRSTPSCRAVCSPIRRRGSRRREISSRPSGVSMKTASLSRFPFSS
jgi:serine/threonine protein kinase